MANLPVPVEGTAVVGVPLTAAFWNTNVRDAINFLLHPPMCVAYQTTATTNFPSGAGIYGVGFDTNTMDSYNGHSTTVNNTRYTGQVPGWYEVVGQVDFAFHSDTSFRIATLFKNGNEYQGSRMVLGNVSTLNMMVTARLSKIYLNGTTDYVEVGGGQNSGVTIPTVIALNGTTSSLDVKWVSA